MENQEIKKLIITFKVQTIRIKVFKGSHPIVFSLSLSYVLSINVTLASSKNP